MRKLTLLKINHKVLGYCNNKSYLYFMERIELLIAKDKLEYYTKAAEALSDCTIKESKQEPFNKSADMYITLEAPAMHFLIRLSYLAGYYEANSNNLKYENN